MVKISPEENDAVYVAVDKEKHSTLAVRWAIDHLVINNQTLVLVHVRTRRPDGCYGGAVEANATEEFMFVPIRTYCARKGITVDEVVLEGADVHGTLLDYINKHHVTNIVLGATSRTALTRKFWTPDVPTLINKSVPDYCSVYIIARNKLQSVRPAPHVVLSPRQPSPEKIAKANHSEFEHGSSRRASPVKGEQKAGEHLNKWHLFSSLWAVTSRGHRGSANAHSLDDEFVDLEGDKVRAATGDAAEVGGANVGENSNEVQKLQHMAEQTMDVYNSACKRQVSFKHRADKLQQLNQDELNSSEAEWLSEEEAFALVEREKAKCRAAMKAAERAQQIAKKEMQRRMQAEKRVLREEAEKNRALDVLSHKDHRYRRYTVEEIQEATNRFASSMKVGEGGYGPVYKGNLDHTPVAIKVLRPDARQGRKQFQQEVEVLSRMRHPNMVILMGACPEYGCLVYEFMDNGSLEDRLFRKGNTPPIPWGIRFKIAADIATGLLFFHQAKPEPLVHRDLKPANILLDHNHTCKISDVGLARLVPPKVADAVTQYHMTSAAGTFCYIDPEYQQTGKLGTKSDIYSLGVMLLQIITARPPMGLAHHVERAIEEGKFEDLLDPAVPDWPVEEALNFAKLALKCTELRKKDRPDLGKEIVPELNRLKEFRMKQ